MAPAEPAQRLSSRYVREEERAPRAAVYSRPTLGGSCGRPVVPGPWGGGSDLDSVSTTPDRQGAQSPIEASITTGPHFPWSRVTVSP
jgi:hypothetical protein